MNRFRHRSRGSITLVALLLAAVIGISLASYIALCKQSFLISTRNQQIAQARRLAEGGLEGALWQLDQNLSPTTMTGSNAMGNGATGTVTTTVTYPTSSTPNIAATATVTAPGLGNFSRTLTATTKPAPLFANAIGIIKPSASVSTGSTYAVIFGASGLVDSWDSDYLESATPKRNYSSTTSYPGTIPSTYTSPPAEYSSASPSTYPNLSFNYAATVAAPNIVLNSAEIRGYTMTFGNVVQTVTGAGGSIVAAPPDIPGTPPTLPPNIDPTRVGKSAFVPNFVVARPTGAAAGTLDGSANITIDNSGNSNPEIWDASASDLTLNGKTVTIKGYVIVRVLGNLELFAGGKFVVYQPPSPTSPDQTGRLEVYVGGDIKVGGTTSSTAGFVNDTDQPKRLALFSTSTSSGRTFQYSTTLPFCGVMYSAATAGAKVDFQATNPQIYGAILANYNVEFSGNPKIHYDLALQYLPKGWFKGVTTPFIVETLTESILPP